MVTTGQTANEWLSDGANNTHPCVTELLNQLYNEIVTPRENGSSANSGTLEQSERLAQKQRQAQAFAGLKQLDKSFENNNSNGKPRLHNRSYPTLDAYLYSVTIPETPDALEGDLMSHIRKFVGWQAQSREDRRSNELWRAEELVARNSTIRRDWLLLEHRKGQTLEVSINYVFNDENTRIDRIEFYWPQLSGGTTTTQVVADISDFAFVYNQGLASIRTANRPDNSPSDIIRRLVIFRDAVWNSLWNPDDDPNELRELIRAEMADRGRLSLPESVYEPYDQGIDMWNSLSTELRRRIRSNWQVYFNYGFRTPTGESVENYMAPTSQHFHFLVDYIVGNHVWNVALPVSDKHSLNYAACARIYHIRDWLVPLRLEQVKVYTGFETSDRTWWSMCIDSRT